MAEAIAIEGGLADPVFEAQAIFRAAMDALAHPGRALPLSSSVAPPAPLTAELAALALTLCDHDSPVWVDATLAASPVVADWLRFHTGAPLVAEPSEAMFALVADIVGLPAFADFALGTDEYPDRSTTLLLAVGSLGDGAPLTLSGPGIETTAALAPRDLPVDFAAQWAENRATFPRGVDLILAAPGAIAALPRTARIREG